MGVTELALDTELSSTQRDYLEMVKQSSGELLQLINQLLDFAKIESGKMTLEPVAFDLRELLDRTTRPLATRARMKHVALSWEIAPDAPSFLLGDAMRLRQVVINLLENAIKFTPAGTIVLQVENCELPGSEAGLHFSIQDTGIGVPLEKQAVIFEAFAQADNSTTRQYGGTGLGLAICQQLVALMGGRIWLESTPGQGSYVSLYRGFRADGCAGGGGPFRASTCRCAGRGAADFGGGRQCRESLGRIGNSGEARASNFSGREWPGSRGDRAAAAL